MNIKTLRERDALRLAQRMNPNPGEAEQEAARHALRLFYNFVAAYQRSFYTEQNRTASQADRNRADAKSENAYKRASEALKPYNLIIDCPGLYPIIDDVNGANFTYGYFYN